MKQEFLQCSVPLVLTLSYVPSSHRVEPNKCGDPAVNSPGQVRETSGPGFPPPY